MWVLIYVAGLVVAVLIAVISVKIQSGHLKEKLEKLFADAEKSITHGDFPSAANQYKAIILEYAVLKSNQPVLLDRLCSIYQEMGIQVEQVGIDTIRQTQKTIVDISNSGMSDSEKENLHRSAMDSLRAQLDALPGTCSTLEEPVINQE